jgi:hypothetical protein
MPLEFGPDANSSRSVYKFRQDGKGSPGLQNKCRIPGSKLIWRSSGLHQTSPLMPSRPFINIPVYKKKAAYCERGFCKNNRV